MAKIEFSSPMAKDHFKDVVANAIEKDTYFGTRGLHNRLQYLLKYGDDGAEHTRKGGTLCQWRVVFHLGHDLTEINICWQTRTLVRQAGKPMDECWTTWEDSLIGGLIGHSDGTWATNT